MLGRRGKMHTMSMLEAGYSMRCPLVRTSSQVLMGMGLWGGEKVVKCLVTEDVM